MKIDDLVTILKDAATFSDAMSKLEGMRFAKINQTDQKGYSSVNFTNYKGKTDYCIVLFDHIQSNVNDVSGLYHYTTDSLFGVKKE